MEEHCNYSYVFSLQHLITPFQKYLITFWAVRLNSTDGRIESDHSKCDQVYLKWRYEMFKSALFPRRKKQIHAFCLRRQHDLCTGLSNKLFIFLHNLFSQLLSQNYCYTFLACDGRITTRPEVPGCSSLHIAAVASKKRVSVSSSMETTLTSTPHNSISETPDHILSGQTESDSLSN